MTNVIKDNNKTEIWNIKKRPLLNQVSTLNIKIERLYVNKAGLKALETKETKW
jgi:hypothetical protein